MRVTKENASKLARKRGKLLESLLSEVDDINERFPGLQLYIDYIDDIDSEWYGLYKIRSESMPTETVGIEMDVDELDTSICVISDIIDMCNQVKDK